MGKKSKADPADPSRSWTYIPNHPTTPYRNFLTYLHIVYILYTYSVVAGETAADVPAMVRFPAEVFARILAYNRPDPVRREQRAAWGRIRVDRKVFPNGLVRLLARADGVCVRAITIGRSEQLLRQGFAWLRAGAAESEH